MPFRGRYLNVSVELPEGLIGRFRLQAEQALPVFPRADRLFMVRNRRGTLRNKMRANLTEPSGRKALRVHYMGR